MKRLLFIGDVHSNIPNLKQLLNTEKVDAVFQVGDFELYHSLEAAAEDKKALKKNGKLIKQTIEWINSENLEPFKTPIYFINGNHEDFDSFKSDILKKLNINYIEPGTIINIDGVNVAGIGGIHSSVKVAWRTEDLKGQDKRFYTEADVNLLYRNAWGKKIDVFITHQAASNVLPKGTDHEGTFYFEEIIKDMKPSYYFHGHHHKNYTAKYNDTEVYGLGNFGKNPKSYKIIET
mgnify:FL=1